MDPNNLPEGYYYDPIHGEIEDFTATDAVGEAPEANTTIFYHEVSRGLVGHAMDTDDLRYKFLAICKADDANPNIRWVDVYTAPPDSDTYTLIPNNRTFPIFKTDIVDVIVVGPDLLVSVTVHAPKEAPRDSNVEGRWYRGICHVKEGVEPHQHPDYAPTHHAHPEYVIPPEPRGGVCVPPGNRPYFRENNRLTRGQVSKMIVLALEGLGLEFPPIQDNQQSFEDVPKGSTFYEYIEKLHAVGAIGGYACTPQP